MTRKNGRRQGIFWLLTIKEDGYAGSVELPPSGLPDAFSWIRGQLECGGNTGYVHWQILVATKTKCSLAGIRQLFGTTVHAELSRSEAAADYVWKEESAIRGIRFEFGSKPICRNVAADWDSVWESAQSGNISGIPADIRIRYYRTLLAIASDFERPVATERSAVVYWGRTGSGKSKRAFEEAGGDCYFKDPRSKFWCGYQGQSHVIIDEFRGAIDLSHMLRWLDRYPVIVEIKGSSRPLKATKFWITSNVDPRLWYPDADRETIEALVRRLNITHFN